MTSRVGSSSREGGVGLVAGPPQALGGEAHGGLVGRERVAVVGVLDLRLGRAVGRAGGEADSVEHLLHEHADRLRVA